MAPEPSHLVNVTKACLRCNSTDVQFMYFNNYKPDQPRYKCHACGRYFTYGGRIRGMRVAQPPTPRRIATAVVAADHRAGPAAPPAAARRGRPRRSQRRTLESGTRQIQETPATCARTEARTVAATEPRIAETRSRRARTEARTVAAGTMVRPTTGSLRPRIPISGQREGAVQKPLVNSVDSPAVLVPVPTTRIAGLMPGDVVDVDERTASRTAAAVIAQGGDVMENWTKAVLGVPPYGLAPASSNVKRRKVMKIRCDGKVSVVPFWVSEDSHDE